MPGKNVLLIAPQPFYEDRGTPINVKLMCQVLSDTGYSIDLLVFPTGQDIEIKNVNIIKLCNFIRVKSIPAGPSYIKIVFDILLIFYICFLLIKKKYNVIHGVEEAGFLAVVFAKIFSCASVYDMDSCISEQLKYSNFIKNSILLKFVSKVEEFAFKKSDLVITVCASLTKRAKKIAPNANIIQVEDIPIERVQPEKVETNLKSKIISEFDFSESLLVVYTGNLQEYQGIDLLLNSWQNFQRMNNAKNNCKLVIVGGPGDKINYYRKKLTNSIAKTVCFVGPRPLAEMKIWMSLSNVLVSPRVEGENTPLKIYSYMQSGRPIVATRRNTHTQVLDDAMAFLSEADPLEFAEAIKEALFNKVKALKKSRKAKEIVGEKYNYKVFQEKLIAGYSSIFLKS